MSDLPRTRDALLRGIEQGLHPAAQLYVSRGGAPVAELALGEARPDVPMQPDTLMLWLSSTKPVAAVAIGQLWERGLLALDDPIAHHVPEFAQNGKDAVTIRHALTHTGGFRLPQVGWPAVSWEETIARVFAARLEPRWVPGEKAGYHMSSSWFALGEVVRRLDGRPFEIYAREEIFLPLGMDDCWIGMPAERYRGYMTAGRLAQPWNTEAREPRPHFWDEELHVTRCSPGGNGWGPMRQLGRFYEMLLAGGALEGRRVLQPQTVEALLARHRVGMVDHTFRQVMDWGLGFIPNSRPGLVETFGAFRQLQAGAAPSAARATDAAPSPPADVELPYHYGPHASRRAVGHSGYRSSTAFLDPPHGLVVALAVTGTPSDEAHAARFREVLAAIYEDLELATAPQP
ncbi:MAG TPA: serine hydrolase domain-containing protein [Thermoanaerobaculia bacterium]|jgi:CubicO group peptidase (beta-lactamase class C family)|nr:serine hydrolase domain-containing protein [Thermoanaerobaculia bacterium]